MNPCIFRPWKMNMWKNIIAKSSPASATTSLTMEKRSKRVFTTLVIFLTLSLTSNCHGVNQKDSIAPVRGETNQRNGLPGGTGVPLQQLRVAAALTASASGVDDEESLDPATMPYFDYGVPRNVSTVVGQHAFILCRVHRMKERSVSWIRKHDLHILTAGVYTYTADQRFVVLHPEKSENWTLQIKYPQVRDSGVYECQVNTEPKISMAFHLTVVESRARIIGGSDIHVQSKSSLRLTCEVEHSPQDFAQVFWHHGPNIIDPQGMYGDAVTSGIQIVTQRSDILRSQLTIQRVRSNHSGNYTCSPTMSIPASVFVHVISGEHPAERLQRGNRSSSSRTYLRSVEYSVLLISLYLVRIIQSTCIEDCNVSSPFRSSLSQK